MEREMEIYKYASCISLPEKVKKVKKVK